MKAQADYANATLERIPGRDALLQRDRASAATPSRRASSTCSAIGDELYYQKRLANENIPEALRARRATAARSACSSIPSSSRTTTARTARSTTSRRRRTTATSRRHFAGGLRGERAAHRRRRDRQGRSPTRSTARSIASPSWLPDGRLMYSRLQKLAPDAPVTDKYQNQRVYVHTHRRATPTRTTRCSAPACRPRDTLDPVELVGRRHAAGLDATSSRSSSTACSASSRIYVAPLAALDGEQDAVGEGHRPRRRRHRLRDRSATTLYLMTHKGAPRFKVLRTSLAKPNVAPRRGRRARERPR